MKVKNAIITAAGYGTRFLPAVKEIPKEMLPIINKPIIQIVVEECLDAGIENIVIVVREGNETIRDYFKRPADNVKELLVSVGKEDRYNEVEKILEMKEVQVINQRSDLPYGNGSPVLSAKDYIPEGEPVAVLFADDLVLTPNKVAISQLVEYFETNQPDAVLGGQRVPEAEVHKYGIIKTKEERGSSEGQIEYIVEKPNAEDAPSDIVAYGRFVMPYEIFSILEELETGLDNELWLQDANSKIAEHGRYDYKVIDGEWFTTGDPLSYFEAVARYYLADEKLKEETKKILEKLQ